MTDFFLIVVLIAGGLVLVLAELCTPSFGMLAVASLACFAYAVYKCFLIHPVLGFLAILVLLVGLPIYLMYLIRFFPKTPLGKRLALRKLKPDTGAGVPEAPRHQEWLGAEGVASSVLRPSGTVTIKGRRVVATAETGFLPAGARVRVVKSTGLNVIVRQIADSPGDAP